MSLIQLDLNQSDPQIVEYLFDIMTSQSKESQISLV